MSKRARIATAGVMAGLVWLGGCSSDGRYGAIRSDLTPELDTLYQRSADIDNALTLMDDENWRMFNEDLGRAFYVNRPSRLTPEPVPR
jgi:hypothetical protein